MNSFFLHRFALFVSFMTFLLLCAGALVTGTGSGLAVPDWPLSFGKFFPPMVGGVLFEHGHRMIAGTVAILSILLCGACWLLEKRRWVKWLSTCAIGIVASQAILGGLTVLFKLPTPISVSHACLAQIFFTLTVILAWVTHPDSKEKKFRSTHTGIRNLAALVTLLFFVQLILGAITRHTGAGLAIPDFPLVFGKFFPSLWTPKIAIHWAHRLGAFTLVALVISLVISIYRRFSNQSDLLIFSGILISLVAVQVTLGALVVWLKRPIPFTTAHLVTGALCLATSALLTIRVSSS